MSEVSSTPSQPRVPIWSAIALILAFALGYISNPKTFTTKDAKVVAPSPPPPSLEEIQRKSGMVYSWGKEYQAWLRKNQDKEVDVVELRKLKHDPDKPGLHYGLPLAHIELSKSLEPELLEVIDYPDPKEAPKFPDSKPARSVVRARVTIDILVDEKGSFKYQ